MITLRKSHKWAMLSITAMALFTACNNDDDNSTATPTVEKPYVVSMAVQGADNTYTYYTVPFADLMTSSLSAQGQGIEQPGYFDFTKVGNTIYSIGGLNNKNVVAIQQNSDSSLKKIGDVNFGTQEISDIVEGDANNLLAVSVVRTSNQIKFYQIVKNTMTVSKTVTANTSDILSQIPGLTSTDGLEYTGMAVVGDKVFLSYYVINTSTFATSHMNRAEVAVYSYPDLKFQKLITDSRVGAIGGFNIKNALIEDESGNVFAVSHTNPANGFSANTQATGVLKIANGTSTFDTNYKFDISSKANGGNAAHIVYLKNGKAFSEINVTAKSSQAAWSDSNLQSAVINFNAQTVNFITGVPEHKGSGRRLSLLVDGDNVYLPVPSNNTINFYKMNTNNYTATKGAEVKANFVAGAFKF